MNVLYRLAALLRKELLQLVKSPKMRTSLFVPPIIQLALLGYAVTLDLKEVDCAVLDRSQTAESREIKSRFAGSPTFTMQPDLESEADLKSRMENRKIQLAVVIPPEFARSAAGHSEPKVQVLVDGRNASSAGMALAYAAEILRDYASDLTSRSVDLGSFRVETRGWHNPNFNMQYFMVPTLLVLITLIDVLMISALSIAREREEGTFEQLRMTPFGTWELLFVKGLATLCIAMGPITICLTFTLFWFQVPFQGSWFLLAALLGTFLSASISIGLFISSLTRNLQQSLIGIFLVIVPFSMLSGMGTPLESMPDGFQTAMLANPLRHGIEALPRIFLEGVGFWELSHVFFFLLSIALTAFCLAYVSFSRQR